MHIPDAITIYEQKQYNRARGKHFEAVYICADCDEPICEGDRYYDVGMVLCEDCIEGCAGIA